LQNKKKDKKAGNNLCYLTNIALEGKLKIIVVPLPVLLSTMAVP
jgi:hypothetical protein